MICPIYRFLIEKELDDYGRIKNKRLLKHLDGCPGCKKWYSSLIQIEHQLKNLSPELSGLQIEQISSKVHSSIAESDNKIEIFDCRKSIFPRKRLAVSAVAAAVIIIFAGLFTLLTPESDETEYNRTMESVSKFSEQIQRRIPRLTNLSELTIQYEIANLETEISNGVTFVKNCLPYSPADSDISRQQTTSRPGK